MKLAPRQIVSLLLLSVVTVGVLAYLGNSIRSKGQRNPKDLTPGQVNLHNSDNLPSNLPEYRPIEGLVKDAGTKAPIRGALISFIEVETIGDYCDAVYTNTIPLGFRGGPVSLIVGDSKSNNSRFVIPGANDRTRVLNRTESDSLGAFKLEIGASVGLIKCEATGYATRLVPFQSTNSMCVIEMYRGWRLKGVVKAQRKQVLDSELRLAFAGVSPFDGRCEGVWYATASRAGQFEVDVSYPYLLPKCQTRGWAISWPVETIDAHRSQPIELRVLRFPLLRVTDANTGKLLPSFSLLVHNNDILVKSAELSRVDRPIQLLAEDDVSESQFWTSHLRVIVWAPGYQSADLNVSDIADVALIECRLQPGLLPTLRGDVHRSGTPLADVKLRLSLGHARLSTWSEESLRAVQTTKSDTNGQFELRAPAGKYVLSVTFEDVAHVIPVQVPGEVRIDLGQLSSLRVTVRDSAGLSVHRCRVLLVSLTTRQRKWQLTSKEGDALFEDLSPGEYLVGCGYGTDLPASQPSRQDVLSVTIRPSEKSDCCLTLPPVLNDEFAGKGTLVSRSGTISEGWRVSTAQSMNTDLWWDVGIDGSFELGKPSTVIFVKSPAGDIWEMTISESQRPLKLEIPDESTGYRGLILDSTTGKPIEGGVIWAYPHGAGAPIVSGGVIGRDGSFSIRGLSKDVTYELGVEAKGYRPVTALPMRRPDNPLSALNIRVATYREGAFEGLPNRRLTGFIRTADGSGRQNVTISTAALIQQDSCILRVQGDGSFTAAELERQYRHDVPQSSMYETRIFWQSSIGQSQSTKLVWQALTVDAAESRDFLLR